MKTARIHTYGFIAHTHRLNPDPRQQPAQLTITEQIVCAHAPGNTQQQALKDHISNIIDSMRTEFELN